MSPFEREEAGDNEDSAESDIAMDDEDETFDPIYGAFVRASAINRVLIESDADDLPGGFVRFLSVTDESVTLRRIWQRGIAIGMRGVTLEVDTANGQIVSFGPLE